MAQRKHQTGGEEPRIRSLRIGIILGGKIIEEKLFREREKISIGQSSKNTFCVPTEGLPKSHPIFTVDGGSYTLNFTPNMDGRVSDGGQVQTLANMRDGVAKRTGQNVWSLQLPEASRGKVVVGGMTLLFQFVNAPPLQPRPRLPASVRGTLADRIEPRLAILLLISILIHTSVAIWASFIHDPMVGNKLDQQHRQFQEDSYQQRTAKVFIQPTAPTETATETETTTTDVAEANPTPTERPAGGGDNSNNEPDPGEKGGDDGAPDDAAIDQAIQDTALLKVLTGDGSGAGRYGKMSETDQGAALADQIGDVKAGGGKVAAAGAGAGGKRGRGPGTGKLGTGKGPGTAGPGGGTKVGEKKEEKIKSRVKFDVDDIDMTSLDPDAVARKIRKRYLAGIKRCHQQVLKRDPKAGGRVSVKFTVSIAGKVTKSTVKGFDGEVDTCIKGLTRRWRFAAPKDDDDNPTTATFVIPLVLKPGG